MGHAALELHFKLGGGALARGALAQLLVPAGAELRAPEAGGAAEGVARADGEVGKLAYAEAGRACVEIEEHGG